jgi:two-component system chemotaxis response regulator CheY
MPAASIPAKAKILVIDDDQMMRLRTRHMLGVVGIENVFEVENGGQAMLVFHHAPLTFDLIMCDWNMPGMSGVQVCQQIRAVRRTVPFVMMTGRLDAESVKTAKEAGVSAYIAKPFHAQQLQAKLASLLG